MIGRCDSSLPLTRFSFKVDVTHVQLWMKIKNQRRKQTDNESTCLTKRKQINSALGRDDDNEGRSFATNRHEKKSYEDPIFSFIRNTIKEYCLKCLYSQRRSPTKIVHVQENHPRAFDLEKSDGLIRAIIS